MPSTPNWCALGAAKVKAMREATFKPKLIIEMWDGTPYAYFETSADHHARAESWRVRRNSVLVESDSLNYQCDLTRTVPHSSWHMIIELER